MSNSNAVTVGTKATVLVTGSPGVTLGVAPGGPGFSQPEASGWFTFANGSGATVYVGGPNVSSVNGYPVAANGTLNGWLWPADAIYGVTASGSSATTVLVTGKAGIA